MNIKATPAFKRCLKKCDDETLANVIESMNAAAGTFGQPHLHKGRGIRELTKGVYECRVGLALRLVFTRRDDDLIFELAGNHDQVRAWMKNRR